MSNSRITHTVYHTQLFRPLTLIDHAVRSLLLTGGKVLSQGPCSSSEPSVTDVGSLVSALSLDDDSADTGGARISQTLDEGVGLLEGSITLHGAPTH